MNIMKLFKEKQMTIDSDGINTKITLPVQMDWAIIIFCCVWVVVWGIGEEKVLNDALKNGFDNNKIFLTWTMGGICMISLLIWNLFYSEFIEFNDQYFKITRLLFNRTIYVQTYEIPLIRNLELNPDGYENSIEMNSSSYGKRSQRSYNRLQFSYKSNLVKFAKRLNDIDAIDVLGKIKKRGFFKE